MRGAYYIKVHTERETCLHSENLCYFSCQGPIHFLWVLPGTCLDPCWFHFNSCLGPLQVQLVILVSNIPRSELTSLKCK